MAFECRVVSFRLYLARTLVANDISGRQVDERSDCYKVSWLVHFFLLLLSGAVGVISCSAFSYHWRRDGVGIRHVERFE